MKEIKVGQARCGFPHPHQWIEDNDLLSIRSAVYEGLARYDKDLNILPTLAESWFVSDDAKNWLFTLRKGVRFHDGSLMTSGDVAASIRNAASPDADGALGTGGLLFNYLGQAEIDPVDEAHLVIRLPYSMADLPDFLVSVAIVPESCIGKASEEIPGTGPFCFAQTNGNRYTLKRFVDYWGTSAGIDSLSFIAEPDPVRRIDALLKRTVDVISGIEGKYTPQIETDDDLCVIEHDSMTAIVLMLNCASGPFADERVRQAVNYGTDLDEIILKCCGGTALPLSGPVTVRHFGANPKARPYPYDTTQAWQLLAEAGYAEGLEVTLYRPETIPDNARRLTKCLQQQWARIGIKLHEVVQKDREQYARDVRDRKIHDLCLFDSSPLSTYRVLWEKLYSVQPGAWYQGYSSAEFDSLFEQAVRTADPKQRKDLYRQAIQKVIEEAPWVFLYSPVDFSAASWDVLEKYPFIGQRADGLIKFE